MKYDFRAAGRAVLVTLVVALAVAGCGNKSANRLPSTLGTSANSACATPQLTISATLGGAGAGQRYVTFALENSSSQQCVFGGTFVDLTTFRNDNVVPAEVRRDTTNEAKPVTLAPRERAFFDMQYSVVSPASEKCAGLTTIKVSPPRDDRQLVLPLTNISIDRFCETAGVTVTPLRTTEGRN